MAVDVLSQIEIDRPPREVAAFACDPDNAPRWYKNIHSVEWPDGRPTALAVGCRVAFVARFLGRRLAYTYEFITFIPDELLVMRTAEGPFPMETRYEFAANGRGGTTMSLRNRGEPSGFGKIAAPLMQAAMLRANRKDLLAIKRLLEDLITTARKTDA